MDWITMKALAKERSRRYGSVGELRADVERHLRNEPVLASPPDRLYAARKFVRRHRAGVAAAAIVALALVAATAISWRQAQRAQQAEARARREAATAARVADFLAGIFTDANPGYARTKELTARELLDAGAARIDADLADQPEVQARLLHIVGDVYCRLGAYEPAIALLERARRLVERESVGGAQLADLLISLAGSHEEQGRLDQALALSERAVSLVPPQDGELLARALGSRGRILLSSGRFAEAEAEIRRALQFVDIDRDPGSVAAHLTNIANCRYAVGDYEGALADYRKVLDLEATIAARSGQTSEHYGAATVLHNTALVYTLLGRFAEARPLELRALAIRENVLGSEHWHVALSLSVLAELDLRERKFESAEALVRRALAIGAKQYDGDKAETAGDLDLLARVLLAAGKPGEAKAHVEVALAMHQRLGAAGDAAPATVTLGDCLRAIGDLDGAARAYAAALEQTSAGDVADAITRFLAHAGSARVALARGDTAAARAAAEQARAAVARVWPNGHPDLTELDADLRAASR
jgi:tetratricopeptide (TPR) repeat protein